VNICPPFSASAQRAQKRHGGVTGRKKKSSLKNNHVFFWRLKTPTYSKRKGEKKGRERGGSVDVFPIFPKEKGCKGRRGGGKKKKEGGMPASRCFDVRGREKKKKLEAVREREMGKRRERGRLNLVFAPQCGRKI